MTGPPPALLMRNRHSLVEIGVDQNTTVLSPTPLISAIAELGSFLARESAGATAGSAPTSAPLLPTPRRLVTVPEPSEQEARCSPGS